MHYEEIKCFLRKKYKWDGSCIIENIKIANLYKKHGFIPEENLLQFLSQFYNYKIEFNYTRDKKIDISFNIQQILRHYPKSAFRYYIEKLDILNITPFAETSNGYIVITVDEKNNIYGMYDNYIVLYGTSFEEMLENLFSRKSLKLF